MYRIHLLSFLGIAAFPIGMAAQAPDSVAKAPAITVTGYATTSFTASTRDNEQVIVGRLYGRHDAQFMLNAADVTIERLPAPDRWDAGFRFEPIVGQNARLVKSSGLDLGPDADVWQAYVMLNMPWGGGRSVQLKAGKMATLMGVEVFEDVLNPTLEVGTQDILLEPFTETGLEISARFGARVDAELRLTNGWDLVVDNNRAKSTVARVGLALDDRTAISFLGYTGPEQANSTQDVRSGAEALASRKFGEKVTTWLQLDVGRESGAASDGRAAAWYAAGFWASGDVTPTVALGMRADYVDDRDGARTSGALGFPVNTGLKLTSVTGTLTIKRWPHALLRPEIRLDHASLAVFDGRQTQWSAAIGLSYLF